MRRLIQIQIQIQIQAAVFLVALVAFPVAGPAFAQEDCNIEDLAAPCALADGMAVQGVIAQQGGRNYFWFGVPFADMHLQTRLTDLPADYDLYLFSDQSPDPTRPVARSINSETTPEIIDIDGIEQGTYLLEVVSDPGQPFDPDQPYTLQFNLTAPPPPESAPAPTPGPQPEPERAVMPPLIGHGADGAAADVRAAGLQPRLRTVDRYSPGGAGTVASQDPPAGAVLPRDAVVDLFVASGDVEIPKVSGLTEQAAYDALQGAGFRVEIRRAHNNNVPSGLAIGLQGGGATALPAGTNVVLEISQGT